MRTATAPPKPVRTLTPLDRCDLCGAEAFVKANLMTGELLFCGHHGHDHMDAIVKVAIEVIDERWAINQSPGEYTQVGR